MARAALREQPQGDTVFDPTLTRALECQQNTESLLEHVAKGGVWAIPVVLFAFFALSICLLKPAQLWRLPKLVRFTPAALQHALADTASSFADHVSGMKKTLLDMARTSGTAR
jgi:biopolymer transport protein ExbB